MVDGSLKILWNEMKKAFSDMDGRLQKYVSDELEARLKGFAIVAEVAEDTPMIREESQPRHDRAL